MWSCVTEIRDFEQVGKDSFLTVEATLSNQVGAQKVLLSTSSPNITINVDNTPIKNAIVYITDDKNGREDLTETINGTYLTSSDFQGIVGNAYTLHINLPNGKKYQSTPEKLLVAPLIDKIDSKFVVKTNYLLNDSKKCWLRYNAEF